MPKYFDAILQDNPEIDVNGDTILYLIEVGKDYSIKGMSAGDIDKVGSDPHTLAPRYWPIKDLPAFLFYIEHQKLVDMIFPDGQLTTEPLTLTVIQSMRLYPTAEAFIAFNDGVRKQLEHEAYNDRLTGEYLTQIVHDYFYQRMNFSNYLELLDAWEELQETGGVNSLSCIAAIEQLNISPADKADFIFELTHGVFSFNNQNQAYIESLFSINQRYPTHFERFAVQVDFDYLLLKSFCNLHDTTIERLAHARFFATRSVLTQRGLDARVYAFVAEYFKHLITQENFHEIRASWSSYLLNNFLGVTSRSQLAQLNIPKRVQHDFYRTLIREYPNLNSQYRIYLFKIFSHTDEFPVHACRFGAAVNLTDILLDKHHELLQERHDVSL